jgi:hypothetical protein
VLLATQRGVVGVGSTSPYSLLSIHANNGSTKTTLFAVGSSTATATTTLFNILNTGNVGIGTTSPSQLLSVQGNGLFSGNVNAANITATGTLATAALTASGNAQITGGLGVGVSNTTAGTIQSSGSITTGSQFIGLGSDAVGTPSYTWSGDLTTGLYHAAGNTIGFTTAGIERARIDGTDSLVSAPRLRVHSSRSEVLQTSLRQLQHSIRPAASISPVAAATQ